MGKSDLKTETNQQKGIDAEVGLFFQPTSGIKTNIEPQNLFHYITWKATGQPLKKFSPYPF